MFTYLTNQSLHNVCTYEVSTLYPLNLRTVICRLQPNKAGVGMKGEPAEVSEQEEPVNMTILSLSEGNTAKIRS